MQKTWTSDFKAILKARPRGHVLAVCFHPALDVTVYTNGGQETHRREDLGGKAVNLARMLYALGANVTLVCPDDYEKKTSAFFQNTGLDAHFVPTNLTLRTNYKHIDTDGTTREQNGTAGEIFPQHYAQLIDRVLHICRTRKITHVALCGSFPQGVEKGVYKLLIEQLSAQHIACLTDCSEEPLSLAVQAKPLLIKPNLQEFGDTFAQDISMLKTQNAAAEAIFAAYEHTGVEILCSMDKRGSIYACKEGVYTVQCREVTNVAGFAGAGDTMLACFIFARYLCACPIEDALRFASAAATAKVRLPANTLPIPDQMFEEWVHTKVRKGMA